MSKVEEELKIWKTIPMKKIGSIEIKYNLENQKGRGFFATEDIKPGTILLQEDPYFRNFENSIKEKMKEILQSKNLKKMIKNLKILHPTDLNELPKEDLQVFQLEYETLISELLNETSEENQKFINKDKLLKLILSLRFNGFQSGIYLHLSIFNHSCQPNCMKFIPNNRNSYSEVVATKFIAKGEECTIPYLQPMEQTKQKRQKDLYKQFDFYCQCSFCEKKENDFEIVKCECGKKKYFCEDCQVNEELITKIQKIEKKLFVIENLIASDFFTKSIKSLFELRNELHQNHILTLRLNKLIVDACIGLLSNDSATADISVLFLKTSLEIYDLQIKFLGKDHCDVATTCNDISNGIDSLIHTDLQVLFEEFPEWKTKEKVQSERKKWYKEFKRISDYYKEY